MNIRKCDSLSILNKTEMRLINYRRISVEVGTFLTIYRRKPQCFRWKYPSFASGFLRDELQKGVGMPLPGAFPEVSVIKCSNYGFASTSMSQVVDRFVFDKIQSAFL